MTFEVLVDDNFHFMDESERDRSGAYATYEEAEAAARAIVEKSVRWEYRPGMTADELWENYTDFGDDPFIRPSLPDRRFSAWDYAEEFAARLVAEQASPTAEPRGPDRR